MAKKFDIALFSSFIYYDAENGSFVWIKNKGRAKAGESVGWVDSEGYIRTKFYGETLWLHVIAWQLVNGPIPDGYEVDHIDNNRLNNAAINLRLATKAQNMHNSSIRVTNKTGVKGVSWHKQHGKYQVQIMLNRKKIHGGYFDSLDEAAVAVRKLREHAHGSYHRHA